MSDSTFILHGSFGSPFENWFPWLWKELCADGGTCIVPHLPSPTGQTFANWSRILDSYVDGAIVTQRTTMVTHSSSGPFVVKYLAERGVSIERLVTVAGFDHFVGGDDDFDRINGELFTRPGDFDRVQQLVKTRYSFWSQSDPFLPASNLSEFAQRLGGEAFEIPEGGHFNVSSGYDSFPALLSLLRDQ